MSKINTTRFVDYGDRFQIAGLQYSDYQTIKDKIKLGDQVRFIGEPKNLYDKLAIRIEWNGIKLGYVPRSKTLGNSPMQIGMWSEHRDSAIIVGAVTFIDHNTVVVKAMVKRLKDSKLTDTSVHFSKMHSELSYYGFSIDEHQP